MYREQYGEYTYWCKGVEGQIILLRTVIDFHTEQ